MYLLCDAFCTFSSFAIRLVEVEKGKWARYFSSESSTRSIGHGNVLNR